MISWCQNMISSLLRSGHNTVCMRLIFSSLSLIARLCIMYVPKTVSDTTTASVSSRENLRQYCTYEIARNRLSHAIKTINSVSPVFPPFRLVKMQLKVRCNIWGCLRFYVSYVCNLLLSNIIQKAPSTLFGIIMVSQVNCNIISKHVRK